MSADERPTPETDALEAKFRSFEVVLEYHYIWELARSLERRLAGEGKQ